MKSSLFKFNPHFVATPFSFTHCRRSFFSQQLNRAFQNNLDDQTSIDENPVTNFLFSELKKLSQGNFNVEEHCSGIQALTNTRFSQKEILDNRSEITHLIESLISGVIDLNRLNKSNIESYLTNTVKMVAMLTVDSITLRGHFEKLYTKFVDDISFNCALFIVKMNEMKRENRELNVVKTFYPKFVKEKGLLNLNELIESTLLFFELIPDQAALDEIQNLILSFGKEVDTNSDMSVILLFNRLNRHRYLNLDLLFEEYLPSFIKNIVVLQPYAQSRVLSCYSQYYQSKVNSTNRKEIPKHIQEKLNKLFKKGEEELTGSISNLKMDDTIELLNSFFVTGNGSKEIFEEIEKHVGKNIDTLQPDRLFIALNTFVMSGKMRPKFLILVQKRVADIKEEFRVKDLAKILRIYTAVETQYEYIYEKCEKYFISLKEYLDYEDLSNLIYAYSNPNLHNKYFILNDFEELISNKVNSMAAEKLYDPLIEILYSYLVCKKGEQSFINKLFNAITHGSNDENISANALFKLYFTFAELKSPLSVTTKFDKLLLTKAINLNKFELGGITSFLTQLNYSNTDTLQIMTGLNMITISNEEGGDEVKTQRKVEYLKNHGINPVFENFSF